jgi:hypothetical protein
MKGLHYLASPYTHKDPEVVQCRYWQAATKTGELMMRGLHVFSPVVHSHPLDGILGKQSHDFWLDQDFAVLRHCSKMLVLRLIGWEQSHGVAQEILFAKKHGIPVEFIDP